VCAPHRADRALIIDPAAEGGQRLSFVCMRAREAQAKNKYRGICLGASGHRLYMAPWASPSVTALEFPHSAKEAIREETAQAQC